MKLVEDLDVYAYRKGWPRWAIVFVPLIYPCSWSIVSYRFGSWVITLRNKWLRRALYIIYFPLKRIVEVLTTTEISEHAVIGEGFYIAHIGNIIIAHHAKIGRYASMHQGVTIGVSGFGNELPEIGDRVYFGAGAKIMGPIKIGDGVVIGANSVVTKDLPDNSIAAGVPAKVLSYKGSDQFVHYRS